MTNIERLIVEKIMEAEYLDAETKKIWAEQISKDGLTPTTTRLLLQLMLDRALAARREGDRFDDPESQSAFQGFMAEIDAAEEQLQKIASRNTAQQSVVQ